MYACPAHGPPGWRSETPAGGARALFAIKKPSDTPWLHTAGTACAMAFWWAGNVRPAGVEGLVWRRVGHHLRQLAGALAALSVAGCDLGPTYHRPALEVPVAYRATAQTAQAAWPSEQWWRGFDSPDLDTLVALAKTGNLDIAAAIARVRQADAQVRIAGAPLLPTLDGTGNASWQHTGLGTGSSSSRFRTSTGTVGSNLSIDTHLYSGELSAGYEADFWGKNSAARQASVSSAMFSRFDQQTVALTVVTDVATTWFAAGTANELDIAQQEALVAGERAIVPSLQNQMEQNLIGLGILVGRPPEA